MAATTTSPVFTATEALALQRWGAQLGTQDNAATADPIFSVQARRRIYGIDPQYDPEIAWLLQDDGDEVEAETAAALEVEYQETRREREGYVRVGYHETWEFVQPFFTRNAAEAFIEHQKHNYPMGLRVYVDSANRNPQWKLIRKALAALEWPEQPEPEEESRSQGAKER